MRTPPPGAAGLFKADRRSTHFMDEESRDPSLEATGQSPIPDPHNRTPKTELPKDGFLADRAEREAAFTLIEMIVVILIIATLAALVMTGASAAFERARKTQAKNDVTQIVTAVNAYYTEYGRYPVNITDPTKDAFFGTGTAPSGSAGYGNNDLLLDVLRSNTDPSGPNLAIVNLLNPRRIVFLTPPGAKNTNPPRGGIASDRRYYDPWASQYAVTIDTNYDNTIANPYSDSDGSAGTNPVRQGVIAYSYGKNGQLGGGAAISSSFAAEGGSIGVFKGSSDIYSW